MHFTRYGKAYQMVINNGDDLAGILTLDEAKWAATSAPRDVFKADPQLLKNLDMGGEGRITCADIKEAITWLLELLPDKSKIVSEFDGNLPLDSVNENSPTGLAILASANYILGELGLPDSKTISIAQIREFLDTVKARALNGDGVLTPLSPGEDKELADFIADIVTATGGAVDLSGSQGANEEEMKTFLEAIPKYLEWKAKGELGAGQAATEVMPYGEQTAAMNDLLQQNAISVDKYFQLCGLLNFDARLADNALSPSAKAIAFDPANQEDIDSYLSALPIARPVAEGTLSLDGKFINPNFQGWWQQVVDKLIRPEFGEDLTVISRQQWNQLCGKFKPYIDYMASKQGAIVESFPIEKLQGYIKLQDKLVPRFNELLAADVKVAETVKEARQVEKLLLYRTYMIRFVNNFVSFSELYIPEKQAMFECGDVVIDGRWFHIAFLVKDMAAHQALAKNSQLFVLYMEVQKDPNTKFNIVVPVTNGTKGNLVVGKRGVFFDREGHDYDAKILQVIQNPICVKEALLAPFSRLWGIIEGKIIAWSGAAEKNLQSNFDKAITPGAAPAAAPPPPPAPANEKSGADSKVNSGAFLGISVAFAALGSALAFISKTLSGMTGTQIWMSVICAILILAFPISLIAIIQLNRQDLSSLLEGCGWAINLRMRLKSLQRRTFSDFGSYPEGATGTPKQCIATRILLVLILAGLIWGGYKWNRHTHQPAPEAPATEAVEAPTAPAEPAPAAPAPAQ